jgi:hypothetical protein
MSEFSAVPAYVWLILLIPSTLIGIVTTLSRTRIWLVALSFSLTTFAIAVAESYYTVVVMQRFDQKFRDAPEVALEISLFAEAVIGMIGVLLFGATLALFRGKDRALAPPSVYISVLMGGIYMILPNAVDIPVALFWIFAVFFPILSARLTLSASPRIDAASV